LELLVGGFLTKNAESLALLFDDSDNSSTFFNARAWPNRFDVCILKDNNVPEEELTFDIKTSP
jgi:hypothetical protein